MFFKMRFDLGTLDSDERSLPLRSKKIPSSRRIMGKCCLHASSFIFYRIIIKVADNQDRHKSSDEFDFGPEQTTHFGVTCP